MVREAFFFCLFLVAVICCYIRQESSHATTVWWWVYIDLEWSFEIILEIKHHFKPKQSYKTKTKICPFRSILLTIFLVLTNKKMANRNDHAKYSRLFETFNYFLAFKCQNKIPTNAQIRLYLYNLVKKI